MNHWVLYPTLFGFEDVWLVGLQSASGYLIHGDCRAVIACICIERTQLVGIFLSNIVRQIDGSLRICTTSFECTLQCGLASLEVLLSLEGLCV